MVWPGEDQNGFRCSGLRGKRAWLWVVSGENCIEQTGRMGLSGVCSSGEGSRRSFSVEELYLHLKTAPLAVSK